MKILTLLFCFHLVAWAQFLTIEMTVEGMDCVSCVSGLDTKLKRLRGVESVTVDAAKKLVALKLSTNNSIRIDRIRDDIKGVGFTPKRARFTAIGKVLVEAGEMLFVLESTNQRHSILSGFEKFSTLLHSGKPVLVEAFQSPGLTPQDLPVIDLINVSAL